jgi:hypothetical protein
MYGHILLLTSSVEHAEQIADWTVAWLIDQKIDQHPMVFVCHDLEMAERSLEMPLRDAKPPSLVILDHQGSDQAMARFSKRLRDCIPESWIVDLVPRDGLMPADPTSAHVLWKPTLREDWEDLLAHLFLRATTPQWSRAIMTRDREPNL